MSLRAEIARAFPSILAHEGRWVGTYRHVDASAQLVDQHEAEVVCTFPDAGAYAYVQNNRFTWSDGRVVTSELPGVLEGSRLFWDVPTFRGYAWDGGGGAILLHLDRKDDPGAHFVEIIVLAPDGRTRARTWHWFKDGVLIRRTLCDERRA